MLSSRRSEVAFACSTLGQPRCHRCKCAPNLWLPSMWPPADRGNSRSGSNSRSQTSIEQARPKWALEGPTIQHLATSWVIVAAGCTSWPQRDEAMPNDHLRSWSICRTYQRVGTKKRLDIPGVASLCEPMSAWRSKPGQMLLLMHETPSTHRARP